MRHPEREWRSPDQSGDQGSDIFRLALLACEAERRSGVLRVAGEPGGVVYLADGGVAAIETAGAPGPDVILLRSGRVPEPSWAAAFTATVRGCRMDSELVRRGLVGAAELEAVLRIALADAMFAVATGQVDDCTIGEATTCLLPLTPPAVPNWLLSETSRRLRVLAATDGLVRHDRDRITADPGHLALSRAQLSRPALSRAPLSRPPLSYAQSSRAQDEVIALANGRRTARDMAFILGCGVYALSLELSRLHAAGFVTITSRRSIGPADQFPQANSPGGGHSPEGGHASDLPRRQPAAGGHLTFGT